MTEIRTEDGVIVRVGDEVYDYYGRDRGEIISEPDSEGWFDMITDDGRKLYRNGARVCSLQYAQAKGWTTTDRGDS